MNMGYRLPSFPEGEKIQTSFLATAFSLLRLRLSLLCSAHSLTHSTQPSITPSTTIFLFPLAIVSSSSLCRRNPTTLPTREATFPNVHGMRKIT